MVYVQKHYLLLYKAATLQPDDVKVSDNDPLECSRFRCTFTKQRALGRFHTNVFGKFAFKKVATVVHLYVIRGVLDVINVIVHLHLHVINSFLFFLCQFLFQLHIAVNI